jgi:hypothetical protein
MNDAAKNLLLGAGLMLVGMVAGAQLFGAPSAVAQSAGYRECFVGFQEGVDIDDSGTVHLPEASRNIRVPSGYTVVSGAGGGSVGRGYVLFCR